MADVNAAAGTEIVFSFFGFQFVEGEDVYTNGELDAVQWCQYRDRVANSAQRAGGPADGVEAIAQADFEMDGAALAGGLDRLVRLILADKPRQSFRGTCSVRLAGQRRGIRS